MSRGSSLPAKIEELISQIDKIGVFEDCWRLISKNLTQLRRTLSEKNTTRDTTDTKRTITMIIEYIEQVADICSTDQSTWKRIDYRKLQSALLHLQFRIAQCETNLRNDSQVQVNILTESYHDQHFLLKKAYDEKMSQNLDKLEQYTAEQKKEYLKKFHEKHVRTIQFYLRHCTELYKSLPVIGLTSEIVCQVAKQFYGLSVENLNELKRKWQGCNIPLTRTFIRMQLDESGLLERSAARRLATDVELNLVRVLEDGKRQLMRNLPEKMASEPYMLSMIENNRYDSEKHDTVTLEDILRKKRWIVILGSPGSGKTCSVRWLFIHLAKMLLSNKKRDRDLNADRIPILVHVRDFAELLSQTPSLTLFDYIVQHTWMNKVVITDPTFSAETLTSVLQDYIKQGQALIILDGLDEVHSSSQRLKVIDLVEDFIENYIEAPDGQSAFDDLHWQRHSDELSQTDGNKLIITSRIVGYHAAPLLGHFAHYIVQSIDKLDLKDYVDYWFQNVHQQILDTLKLSKSNKGTNHGETFKKQLAKDEIAGLRGMPWSCSLMSFICGLAFDPSKTSVFTASHVEFYQWMVNVLVNSNVAGESSTQNESKLFQILSDASFYIQRNSLHGLISEGKLKGIFNQHVIVNASKKLDEEEGIVEPSEESPPPLNFSEIFCGNTGIMTAQGESVYGFMNAKFQEYFTCLKLTSIDAFREDGLSLEEISAQSKGLVVTEALRPHMNDPRFQTIQLISLSRLSYSWTQTDFDEFCRQYINKDGEVESLVPLGPLFLIHIASDLVHQPAPEILFAALDQLVVAAGSYKWSRNCPLLFNRIATALTRLPGSIVPQWIKRYLSKSPRPDIESVSALCKLIEGKPGEYENIRWLDQACCLTLQSISKLDYGNNQFTVERLLIRISFSDSELLSTRPNTLKEFLIKQNVEPHTIPIFLFPIIIILYGGLKRNGRSIVFDPSHIYRESKTVTRVLLRHLSKESQDKSEKGLINARDDFQRVLLAQIEVNVQSPDIVDLCIATVCLCGIDFVQKHEKSISNELLNMCINRLKHASIMLRQIYFSSDSNDYSIESETTKFISGVVKRIHFDESTKKQFLSFLDSFRSGLARLRSSSSSILLKGESSPDKRMTLYLPTSLHREYAYLMRILTTDMKFKRGQNACTLLSRFIRLFWILEHDDDCDTVYRMGVAMDDVPQYLLLYHDEDLLFPLVFVPRHLQDLFGRLIETKQVKVHLNKWEVDGKEYLFYSHILVECLLLLSNASCNKFALLSALIALLPLLRIYKLENFASSLLWTLGKQDYYILEGFESSKQHPMNDETGLYFDMIEDFLPGAEISDEERQTYVEYCIEQEHKRFRSALIDNNANSTRLYSACVSLARVARWDQKERKLHLLEESVRGALLIESKLVRLDALSVILLYSTSEYNRIKLSTGRSLQKEIEHQFTDIFPDLPVLLHTVMFIRCLPLLQRQETIENCRKNLLDKFSNTEPQDQAIVYEALLPYLQSNSAFLPFQQSLINNAVKQHQDGHSTKLNSYSSTLKECFIREPYKTLLNDSLSLSLTVSNMYVLELTSELRAQISISSDFIQESNNGATAREEFGMILKLFQFKNTVLTVGQSVAITDLISSTLASNRWKYPKKFWTYVNNALHHLTLIEFKACRLVECWMRWKESTEMSLFALHGALLLVQSDFWSVEAATIVCDLLDSENDRFRQKAEIALRSATNHNLRTSGKLDIDVLLTITKKMAHFQHVSPFAKLTLSVMFDSITLDIQSHLETFLWLERYRIYALMSKKNSFNKLSVEPISQFSAYFPSDNDMDVSICGPIRNISGNLLRFMCELIQSNFASFLEIDGDITSKLVLDSHVQFIVSVLVSLATLSAYDDETRSFRVDALLTLADTSTRPDICEAAVCAAGYILDAENCKKLFFKLQTLVKQSEIESNEDLERLISTFIESYCHFIAVYEMDFDQDEMDFFQLLLAHSSPIVVKAAHVGLARVLKDRSSVFQVLEYNYIECYHALMSATAYFFGYAVQHRCAEQAAAFIEEHPNLLSLFVLELYQNTRQFTKECVYRETTDNILAYGYPQYVEVASLIVTQMPSAFISCVQDSGFEIDLKRAIFCTSKQHDFSRRISCIIILSAFGEFTVDLCEMFIDAFLHDSLIRHRSYQCLARLTSITDENAVQKQLFAHLKSKSMTVRYSAVMVLLHLVQSHLIPYSKARSALDELMSDPMSEEDLWLEQEQTHYVTESSYYYVGPLKDVVYALLVNYITGDKPRSTRRNELGDIEADFLESEKVSSLASCLYGVRTSEDDAEIRKSITPCEVFDDAEDSDGNYSTASDDLTDDENNTAKMKQVNQPKKPDENPVQPVKIQDAPQVTPADDTAIKEKPVEPDSVRSSVNNVYVNVSETPSIVSAPAKTKSGMCVIL